ncbi:MAG: energy transducer TonB [Crocinitomicaceae bacterium]
MAQDTISKTDTVLDFSDINPEFIGGESAMSDFIRNEFSYPEEAREMGEQGLVFVEFIVQSDGSITDVKTVKSVSKSLDAEAERVIKAMPKWKPGEQDGVPVNVRYTVPFKCVLATSKKRKLFRR